MQFSLSTFTDLLSEFQKYLSDRIPKAVYYSLGLVVVALGAIIGYIMGWGNIADVWNKTDTFYKIVLAAVAGLIFFLLAYVLGSLQGAVERGFQGDLPFHLGERLGLLERHRGILQARYDAFHQMTTLYNNTTNALDQATRIGSMVESKPKLLKTARTLARYHVISNGDLETKEVDDAPPGSLQNLADALGMMIQHPLEKGVNITSKDVVYLPDNLKNPAIIAVTLSAEKVPTGLVAGDTVIIYNSMNNTDQCSSLKESLLMDVQPMIQEDSKGAKFDLIHLTLAVAPEEVAQFVNLPSNGLLYAVRIPSNSTATTAVTTVVINEDERKPTLRDIFPFESLPEGITHLSEDIQILRQQYENGQNWLQHMQPGTIEASDAQPYLKAIAKALALLELLHNSLGSPGLETASTELNGYIYNLIELLIKILGKQYEKGEKWLERLRTGTIESFDARPNIDAITKALQLLTLLRVSQSTTEADKLRLGAWRVQILDYRIKWINDLLRNALNELIYRVDQSNRSLHLYYPVKASAIAPTAIGNVFRAVDSYCDTMYGLDTGLVLPRLQVVMEQKTLDKLSKAHEQLALLEWLYLAIFVIGVVGTFIACLTHHYLLAIILWFLVLPIPQIILYPAALMSAIDYASALRLAYDRERGKVIKMMGLSLPTPTDQREEKALWLQIQKWWEYGTPPGNYTLDLGEASSGKNE